MTIKHRRNRRWYWPFRSIFLEHGESLSSRCVICSGNKLSKTAKHAKTISPTFINTTIKYNSNQILPLFFSNARISERPMGLEPN